MQLLSLSLSEKEKKAIVYHLLGFLLSIFVKASLFLGIGGLVLFVQGKVVIAAKPGVKLEIPEGVVIENKV